MQRRADRLESDPRVDGPMLAGRVQRPTTASMALVATRPDAHCRWIRAPTNAEL
jgi:hypothetical protein